MNALITIERAAIGTDTIPTCNARELHGFLEVGRDFSTWIKDRITEYSFIEGQDFSPILGKSTGGRPTTEYYLSLDMAKELSMVERNEKGKQARRYFIECERQAKAGKRIKPLSPIKQAKEAVSYFAHYARAMQRVGFDKNAALISANQATRKVADTDILALGGNTHLVAENQDSAYYTPTALGKPIGLSAIRVNRLLALAGLQERFGEDWEATAAGKAHSRRFDTAKCHSDGTPVTQLKWARSVLPLIQTPPLQQAA